MENSRAGRSARVSRGRQVVATFAASITALGLTASGSPAFAAGGAAHAKTASQKAQAVIVVLRDQLPRTPARRSGLSARASAGRVSQSAVLHRLAGPKPKHLKQYGLVNAFSATVTAAQARALAHDPAVASVTPDRLVSVAPPSAAGGSGSTGSAKPHASPAAATPSPVDPAACSSDPAHPVLEPEALQTINARSSDPNARTAAALGIDGTGVKVGFIADGINPNNPGFIRTNGNSAIIDYKDFYGDGPNAPTGGAEAFGDASAIAAQGNVVYDVADYSNPTVVSYPGGHCYIKIVGVAPGADVVALKAGSELLPNSAILQAIDYAVRIAHVDVLNESFGANLYPDVSTRNTIQQFDDMATAAGVTVTVSTGDAGVTSTIGNPGTDPKLISAGAVTDARLYEQTGYALAARFGNGHWLDDNISSLSSAGVTQNGRTIDLSAPGEADWAVCDDSGNFQACTTFQHSFGKIQAFGGTSQSAPLTAGAAALVIQAYRSTHGGGSPTPALVKQILTSTAHDLGLPGSEQGSGVIDTRAAVEAALTFPGNGTPAQPAASSNVLVTPGQLTLTGNPGSNVTGQVAVTNVGQSPVTVLPATRTEATLSHQVQTAAISNTSSQTTPYPTTGAPWVYTTKTFTVPTGADRLNATILWQSGAAFGGPGPVVRMSLFDPNGTYAANTRPQGGAAPANYGNVDVRQPTPGTWTAVLYTPANTGFTGNVTLQTDTLRNMPVGSVSPSLLTLAPGEQQTVSVTMRVPADGGDAVNTLSIASSGGHETAVPLVLRALVDTAKGYGTFTGTILGGNARSFAPAQTLSYEFDVPPGMKDVDVITSLTRDSGDLIETVLVDPAGETPSVEANVNPDVSATTGDAINVVASPAPGRWRFVVVVQNPVSGKEISQDIKGHVLFNQQSQHGAIPTGGQVLPRGVAHSVTLTVHNPRPVPIALQADARTNTYASRQLAPQFAGSTIPLPLSVDNLSNIPAWLVPPDTTHVDVSSAATVPAQVELSSPGGGIDVFGDLTAAQGGSTISTANVNETLPEHVAQGFWFTYVQEIGPYGDSGAPAGSAHLVANAVTKGFDTSVTTSTGDPYRPSTNAALSSGTPVVVPAHGNATITVTFTPNARKGTLINGVLHLVIPPAGVAGLFNTTGDVIATVPYSYRVG